MHSDSHREPYRQPSIDFNDEMHHVGVYMIPSSHLLVFLTAATLLAVSPGPGMLYVLARSLRGGRRVGLASSFGTAAGGLAHVVAAALGLSAVLARSASAFLIVISTGSGSSSPRRSLPRAASITRRISSTT